LFLLDGGRSFFADDSLVVRAFLSIAMPNRSAAVLNFFHLA
jgi:hypothetical protein